MSTARAQVILFIWAAVLLVFAELPIHYVGPSDEAGYLAVARSAPAHVLYDGRRYVLHPPAYPLAIRAASLLALGDVRRGGVILGVLCGAGVVVATFRLARALGAGPEVALAAALGLASTRLLSYTAQGEFREPFEMLLLLVVLVLIVDGAPAPLSRRRLIAAAAFGAIAALTWDPIGVAAPLFAVAGAIVGRRRAGLVIAAVMLAAWVAWAGYRARLLSSFDAYPAGIDGMVETTRDLPLGAVVNPNFLSQTKAHNGYFWRREPTPIHLLWDLGPALLARDTIYADYPQPAPFLIVASAVVALAALGLARARGAVLRAAIAVALPLGFVSGPGLVGNTARYLAPVVPLVFALAALGARAAVKWRWKLEPRAARAPLVAAAAVLVVATAIARPRCALARPDVFEGRAAARAIEASGGAARVAAYVGLPPELCWLLPASRVVALPLDPAALDAFLAANDPDVIVVPVMVARDSDPPSVDERRARGLDVLERLGERVRDGSLVPLGLVVEAEVADFARLHAYQLLAPRRSTAKPFGFLLEPGEAAACARAVREPADRRSAEVIGSILRAHRAELERSSDPGAPELLEAIR